MRKPVKVNITACRTCGSLSHTLHVTKRPYSKPKKPSAKLLATLAAKKRSSRPFDPTKLSIKDKIKHAVKPDVITVRRGRLPARNRYGYRMVRVGHKIQYRKIKGPTEAKIDKTLAKSRLLSQWKRASSAQRRAFLAGTIAAGPAGGLTAAALANKFPSKRPPKTTRPRKPTGLRVRVYDPRR